MLATWTGIHRIRGGDSEKNRVRITDGEVTHDELTEQDYRGAKFQPPFDDLPWTEDTTVTPALPHGTPDA